MIYRITSDNHDSHHTVALLEGPDKFNFLEAELSWLRSEPPGYVSKDHPAHRSSAIGYFVDRLDDSFVDYLKKNHGFTDVIHRVFQMKYDNWVSFNCVAGYQAETPGEFVEPSEGESFTGDDHEHTKETHKIERAWIKKLEADPNSILNQKENDAAE
jgi:hypothetical protein